MGKIIFELTRKEHKKAPDYAKNNNRALVNRTYVWYNNIGATNNGRRLASNAVEIRDHLSDCSEKGIMEVLHMISAIEIIGAIASAVTIFSAGVAVGRYLSSKK